MPNEGQGLLQEIGNFFESITSWIPFAAEKFEEIIIGTIPDDDYDAVYEFAGEWGKLAQAFGDYMGEAAPPGQIVAGNWSGDATAAAYTEYWRQISLYATSLQEAGAQMQMDVQSYGLQLEIGFYMFILNLVLLAVMLVIDIILSVFFGISLGDAVARFISTRLAMLGIKEGILAALKRLALAALRPVLEKLATGAAKTAVVRAGIGTLTRPVMSYLADRGLSTGLARLDVGLATRALAAPLRRIGAPVLERVGLGMARTP